jgi:hypothetical protein
MGAMLLSRNFIHGFSRSREKQAVKYPDSRLTNARSLRPFIPGSLWQPKIESVAIVLESVPFFSRHQAKHPHVTRVLPIGDEFRERTVF